MDEKVIWELHKVKVNKKNAFLIVITICSLVIGTYVCFHCGLTTDLWEDEALSYFIAKNTSYHNLFFSAGNYVDFIHPPFYYIFLKFGLRFNESDWWLRLISLAWFLPSLYLVFLIGKKIKNEKIGLAAVSLFALHPLLNGLAFQVRPYSMVIFFMLLSIYLLLKQLEKNTWKNQLLTAVALTISFYTDYASVWLIAGFFCFGILLLWKDRKTLEAKSIFSTLVIFSLLSSYQIGILLHTIISDDPHTFSYSVPFLNIAYLAKEINQIVGLNINISVLGSLIIIFSIIRFKKIKKIDQLFFVILIGALGLSILYSLIGKPVFLARNLVVVSICFIFVFVQCCYQNFKHPLLPIMLILLAYGYQTINRQNFLYREGMQELVETKIFDETILVSFAIMGDGAPYYARYYLKQEKKQPLVLKAFDLKSQVWLQSQVNKTIFFIDDCYDKQTTECIQLLNTINNTVCKNNFCNRFNY